MSVGCEYLETRSTTTIFEWQLRDVKNLFESRYLIIFHPHRLDQTKNRISNGQSKSKVTRSVKFGEGRWQVSPTSLQVGQSSFLLQILFYASGTTEGECIGLFLAGEVRRNNLWMWSRIWVSIRSLPWKKEKERLMASASTNGQFQHNLTSTAGGYEMGCINSVLSCVNLSNDTLNSPFLRHSSITF